MQPDVLCAIGTDLDDLEPTSCGSACSSAARARPQWRRVRVRGRRAWLPPRSPAPSAWRCGVCIYLRRLARRGSPRCARRAALGSAARAIAVSATGRKSKMPPPSLSSSTIVSFKCEPRARLAGHRCRTRVPRRRSAARPDRRPAAARRRREETVPSIPLAPRLHSTRGGSVRAGQNVSMSRTGIEEATNNVACSGSSTPSSAATVGSESCRCASAPKIASAARSSALRQLASQSSSAVTRAGQRQPAPSASRQDRAPANRRAPTRGLARRPRDRAPPDHIGEACQPGAQVALKPAGRRPARSGRA